MADVGSARLGDVAATVDVYIPDAPKLGAESPKVEVFFFSRGFTHTLQRSSMLSCTVWIDHDHDGSISFHNIPYPCPGPSQSEQVFGKARLAFAEDCLSGADQNGNSGSRWEETSP